MNWDGDWPAMAADLPVRGVVQQLAMQTELVRCEHESSGAQFHLRVPMDTLRAGSNTEKLAAALSERFAMPVRITTEVGVVKHTAGARALEERAARQRQAEHIIQNDPVAQNIMREFGATIVPGSVRPA